MERRIGLRQRSGTVLIELAASAFAVSVMAFIFVNFFVTLYSIRINDELCRDACRAAASERNYEDARDAASAVIQVYKLSHDLTAVRSLKVESVAFQNLKGSRPNNAAPPFVVVRTGIDVAIPKMVFLSQILGGDKLHISQQYSFPLLNKVSETDKGDVGDLGDDDDNEAQAEDDTAGVDAASLDEADDMNLPDDAVSSLPDVAPVDGSGGDEPDDD